MEIVEQNKYCITAASLSHPNQDSQRNVSESDSRLYDVSDSKTIPWPAKAIASVCQTLNSTLARTSDGCYASLSAVIYVPDKRILEVHRASTSECRVSRIWGFKHGNLKFSIRPQREYRIAYTELHETDLIAVDDNLC